MLYFIFALGFLLLIGTAGAADLNPMMPMWEILAQAAVAYLAMFYSVKNLSCRSK